MLEVGKFNSVEEITRDIPDIFNPDFADEVLIRINGNQIYNNKGERVLIKNIDKDKIVSHVNITDKNNIRKTLIYIKY